MQILGRCLPCSGLRAQASGFRVRASGSEALNLRRHSGFRLRAPKHAVPKKGKQGHRWDSHPKHSQNCPPKTPQCHLRGLGFRV